MLLHVAVLLWGLTVAHSLRPDNFILNECCLHLKGNVSSLRHCVDDYFSISAVKQRLPKMNASRLKIGLVTFATENINTYAAYSAAITGAYSFEMGNMEFVSLSPETGDNYEPRDARWNRVRILDYLLSSEPNDAQQEISASYGLYRDMDYIIWLDADLIITNWDATLFDIRAVIHKYRHSHIIVSAEHHSETGVANTGSLILKNSPWSRSFLQSWWSSYDHTLAHDQIYFDRLYKSYPRLEREYMITITPTNLINSVPPAMLYQQDSDAVLHLMGELNDLRAHSFRTAFQALCTSYQEHPTRLPPAQLTLTRAMLYSMSINLLHRELKGKMEIMSDALTSLNVPGANVTANGEALLTLLSSISEARELALQIYKSSKVNEAQRFDMGTSVTDTTDRSDASYAMHLNKLWVAALRANQLLLPDAGVHAQIKVNALNLCATIGHDKLSHEQAHLSSLVSQALRGSSSSSIGSVRSLSLPAHTLEHSLLYSNLTSCLTLLATSTNVKHKTVISEMRSSALQTRARYVKSITQLRELQPTEAGDHRGLSDNLRRAATKEIRDSYEQAIELLSEVYYGAPQDYATISTDGIRRRRASNMTAPNLYHLVPPLASYASELCQVSPEEVQLQFLLESSPAYRHRADRQEVSKRSQEDHDEQCKSESGLRSMRRGLYMYDQALELQEVLLEAEQQIKEDHVQFVTTVSQAAICASKISQCLDSLSSTGGSAEWENVDRRSCEERGTCGFEATVQEQGVDLDEVEVYLMKEKLINLYRRLLPVFLKFENEDDALPNAKNINGEWSEAEIAEYEEVARRKYAWLSPGQRTLWLSYRTYFARIFESLVTQGNTLQQQEPPVRNEKSNYQEQRRKKIFRRKKKS